MSFFMLDMGSKIYGDCLLVAANNQTILIDGGHPGDHKPRGGSEPSIPEQFATLFGHAGPYPIDLLIVTHCHSDHIGCLPEMVKEGTILVKSALVADPDLGFPQSPTDTRVDQRFDSVVRAMREEPRADLPPDELREFLQDAVKLETRYRDMLSRLSDGGCRVSLFKGKNSSTDAIEAEFSGLELKVLGPTASHLKKCRDSILQFDRRVTDALVRIQSHDRLQGVDVEQVYRMLAADEPRRIFLPDDLQEFLDMPGKGAAINNQSIILSFKLDGGAFLLTGDMQLEKAEVTPLNADMKKLLSTIADAGPYKFVKAAHHASYNGLGEDVFAALGEVDAIGISTGRQDPGHPHSSVLALLKERRNRVSWARTDKNGLVHVIIREGDVLMRLARGALDDDGINARDAAPPVTALPEAPPTTPRPIPAAPPPSQVTPTFSVESGTVEIVARIPHRRTRVTLTIDIAPEANDGPAAPLGVDQARRLELPARLPKLLFVTNGRRLCENIGSSEAAAILDAIRRGEHALVDIDQNGNAPNVVRSALAALPEVKGVVIIGGYDIVPSERYDSLPPSLRAALAFGVSDSEPDDFIVWSDQVYGDRDGDGLADLPVSRIPDGHSAQLVRTALTAPATGENGNRFGIRNARRPFADGIFERHLRAAPPMHRSQPVGHQMLGPSELDADMIYVMLHGSDSDASRFWGETQVGSIEAMHVGNIPNPCGATVLSGCCWGALTVKDKASAYDPRSPIRALRQEESLALSFLAAGARSFVGCTGAHYSPLDGDMNFFGAPMHDAFWKFVKQGHPPALALFEAKLDYLSGMPHGRVSLEEQAIEHKILRQFTCLGLGW